MLKRWVAMMGVSLCLAQPAISAEKWFEDFKAKATPQEMYTFLYALPKGGDLHNHLQGAIMPEWMWDATMAAESKGYVYYTKVRINNCVEYGRDEYGRTPYLLVFLNIEESSYKKLSDCEKSEYKKLQDLDAREKAGWLSSMTLDKPWEGRDEFFQAHWGRINDLIQNPYIVANTTYKNMEAFGKEGVVYIEGQMGLMGYQKPDGSLYSTDEVADIFRGMIASKEAKATGVTLKLQNSLLRFAPNAEDQLRALYAVTDKYRDLYVGVNMVGREDNGKGYPLRFLPTLRELRKHYPDINLSIHAGETDEPDNHIRDTLLLGAMRIGHGVNLIRDPETMTMMRNGPYMVEINLISNLMLEYVQNFQQHPFPEYLRIGVPVALSTDDRGMWGANMTDEYYVAVHEFNLSWEELTVLARNSLKYSFLDDATKQKLLADYEKRIQTFKDAFEKKGMAAFKDVKPVSYSFTCKHYQLCIH
jgi:adenosine deaminase CECR1